LLQIIGDFFIALSGAGSLRHSMDVRDKVVKRHVGVLRRDRISLRLLCGVGFTLFFSAGAALSAVSEDNDQGSATPKLESVPDSPQTEPVPGQPPCGVVRPESGEPRSGRGHTNFRQVVPCGPLPQQPPPAEFYKNDDAPSPPPVSH
jgi:hypothetical protein